MGHGFDEHLRIRVMVGVAMGYDDRIETLGIQTGPVREDEGAWPGVYMDLSATVHNSEASCSTHLCYRREAAAAGSEEVHFEGI
jgi:hypothetical protein